MIKINRNIPTLETKQTLILIARLCKNIPKDTTVLILGSFYGAVCWVVLKNTHPSIKIIATEDWNEVSAQ